MLWRSRCAYICATYLKRNCSPKSSWSRGGISNMPVNGNGWPPYANSVPNISTPEWNTPNPKFVVYSLIQYWMKVEEERKRNENMKENLYLHWTHWCRRNQSIEQKRKIFLVRSLYSNDEGNEKELTLTMFVLTFARYLCINGIQHKWIFCCW